MIGVDRDVGRCLTSIAALHDTDPAIADQRIRTHVALCARRAGGWARVVATCGEECEPRVLHVAPVSPGSCRAGLRRSGGLSGCPRLVRIQEPKDQWTAFQQPRWGLRWGLRGVPDLGIYWQKIENEALRAYCGLGPDQTGVRISRILHGSSAHPVLQIDDVITSIDGTHVASDGTIALREHGRVQFEHLVSQHQVGDALEVGLLRRGEPMTVELQLRPYVSLVPLPRPDRRPTYLIFAGLLFTPLSYEYINEWEWARDHHRYGNYGAEVFPSDRRRQIVVIHQVLAHEINLGYHQMGEMVVERVNGIEISAIEDVVRALASPQGEFHVIETDFHGPRSESQRSDYHSSYGTRIVLDASKTERATAEILEQHGIPSDRSADLR